MVELQTVPGSDAEAEAEAVEARALSQGEMLVELAGSAGCALEPVAFSVLLRGRCPFHYGPREGVVGVRGQGRGLRVCLPVMGHGGRDGVRCNVLAVKNNEPWWPTRNAAQHRWQRGTLLMRYPMTSGNV